MCFRGKVLVVFVERFGSLYDHLSDIATRRVRKFRSASPKGQTPDAKLRTSSNYSGTTVPSSFGRYLSSKYLLKLIESRYFSAYN